MRMVGVGGLFLLLSLACAGPGGRIRIVEVGGDDGCSTMLNYCLRARCSLENTGDDPKSTKLTFLVSQADGRADKHVETVTLGGGELKTFTHDFKSAGLLAGQGKVECRVD